MLTKDLLNYIEDTYDYVDILYIIGKDKAWLLRKIKEEILAHKEDFFEGDKYYSEVYDG